MRDFKVYRHITSEGKPGADMMVTVPQEYISDNGERVILKTRQLTILGYDQRTMTPDLVTSKENIMKCVDALMELYVNDERIIKGDS